MSKQPQRPLTTCNTTASRYSQFILSCLSLVAPSKSIPIKFNLWSLCLSPSHFRTFSNRCTKDFNNSIFWTPPRYYNFEFCRVKEEKTCGGQICSEVKSPVAVQLKKFCTILDYCFPLIGIWPMMKWQKMSFAQAFWWYLVRNFRMW